MALDIMVEMDPENKQIAIADKYTPVGFNILKNIVQVIPQENEEMDFKWKAKTLKAIDQIGKLAQQGLDIAHMVKPKNKGIATADRDLAKGITILKGILQVIPDNEENLRWKGETNKALDIIK